MFIESKRVVEIAAHPIAQKIMHGETATRHLRQFLRQKARLDTLRQLKLMIDLLVQLLETLVNAMDLGSFAGQSIVRVLDAEQRLDLRQQFAESQGAHQISIGSRLETPQTSGRTWIVGDVEDRHKEIIKAIAQPAAQIPGGAPVLAALNHDQLVTAQSVWIGISQQMSREFTARAGQDMTHLGQGGRLVGANENSRQSINAHNVSPQWPTIRRVAAGVKRE